MVDCSKVAWPLSSRACTSMIGCTVGGARNLWINCWSWPVLIRCLRRVNRSLSIQRMLISSASLHSSLVYFYLRSRTKKCVLATCFTNGSKTLQKTPKPNSEFIVDFAANSKGFFPTMHVLKSNSHLPSVVDAVEEHGDRDADKCIAVCWQALTTFAAADVVRCVFVAHCELLGRTSLHLRRGERC